MKKMIPIPFWAAVLAIAFTGVPGAFLLWNSSAQPPSQTGFLLQWTGAKDENDLNAAVVSIDKDNIRRAAVLPDPLPVLPTGTDPEIVASYETVLIDLLEAAHEENILTFLVQEAAEFEELLLNADDAGRAAAKTALEN